MTEDAAQKNAPHTDAVAPLTDAEEQWVQDRLGFARQEGVDHLELDQVSAYADRQLAAVQAGELEPEVASVMLDVVAVLIGEHLGAAHGLQWVTVKDDDGTHLGLRDPFSSAVLFPQSTVGTHWNEGATGWVPEFVEWFGGQVRQVRGQE
ncbi:hypothetical protein HMPREF2863_01320 [Micrococcus sp. HMSC067E09]|uniref:DUF3806 domain-containing protein n=1 Tax=Micrococcus sp. HMSC067E09 TaxID=1739367 RepID=UPI0008A52057|nr:DUF3806 domain-containing protein [Micrococcus sp. HMSC067E09]OFR88064.1 hypothetical protein HMPREF2863_01320 [Micrococcus sp. HMSC067E09]